MRRRILAAILAITGLSILLFGVPLAVVFERLVDQDATLRLERQAILAAGDVPADYATSNDPVELPPGTDSAALALYGTDGVLVTGDGPPTADAVTQAALTNQVGDTEADHTRVVAVPVTADEHVVGAIRAQQPTAVSDARTWRLLGLLAGLAAAVFAIGAGIAALVARRLAHPVGQLTDAVTALGEGAFDIHVPPVGVEEIDTAGRALTATAHRLDTLVQRERAFSADASHQLRTPLAGLRAAIETEIQFPRPDPSIVLTESLVDIDRLERTISELLWIARSQQAPEHYLDLSRVIAGARDVWHGRLAAAGRPLRIDVPDEPPPVLGNSVLLRHALDVVLDNALVHGGGVVTISARVTASAVTLSIRDEGPGFELAGGSASPTEPHGRGLELADRLLAQMAARLVISRRAAHPVIAIVLTPAGTGAGPGLAPPA